MDQGQTTRVPVLQSQPAEDPASHPENTAGRTTGSPEGSGGHDTRPTSSTQHLISPSDAHTTHPRSHDNPYTDFERVTPPLPPARSRDGHARVASRRHAVSLNAGFLSHPQNASGLDYIVPVDDKSHVRRTIGERLEPTIENAVKERDKYAKKALWTGYALNIAIGMQVALGALTTGLAAAIQNTKQAQVSTAVLGGLATLVASYLARARGSGEPELSITRVKDLEQFLRDCRAFQLDHAHEYGTPENGLNYRLDHLRGRFEELLGNADGQRRLSPVGITTTAGATTTNATTGATTASVPTKSAV